MKVIKYILLYALAFFPLIGMAQIEVAVSIENETNTGSDYFFELYLNTTANSSGDLLLSQSDFVINFNPQAFSSPIVEKVPNPTPAFSYLQNGFCSFVSTNHTDPSDFMTIASVQYQYYSATAIYPINNHEFIINVSNAILGDQTDISNQIARITATPSTHCLGRFKISGFNPTQSADLSVETSVPGFESKVFRNLEDGYSYAEQVVIADWVAFAGVNSHSRSSVQLSPKTKQANSLKANVIVSPNPTLGLINIDIGQLADPAQNVTIQLFANTGKLLRTICSGNCKKEMEAINLTEFGTGVFYLKVASSQDSHVSKVVVMD